MYQKIGSGIMPKGILIFGANGTGKTTLARKLAEELKIKYIDIEDYYFEKSDMPYSKSRSKQEVLKLILADIQRADTFVLSAVKGEICDEITSMYIFAFLLSAPLEIRLERVKNRSEKKFGKRVLVGGDMYEQENKFYEFVKNRNLSSIDDWANSLKCPVIKLDGQKPISENADFIIKNYQQICSKNIRNY